MIVYDATSSPVSHCSHTVDTYWADKLSAYKRSISRGSMGSSAAAVCDDAFKSSCWYFDINII